MNKNIHPLSIALKALFLFVLINLAFVLINPPIADMSIYNLLVPGLKRMPFGITGDPYTVTMDNADAMFASHEISAAKKPDELRVALIGDSSIWGDGLAISETLAAQWNQSSPGCNRKTIKIYNLGYPHPSILKDLVFIDELKTRQPDAIIWFVTLNTLMNQYRQNPFTLENRARILQILATYDIPYGSQKVLSEMEESLYQKTLAGQRSFLARWLKLQGLGLVWSATGKDSNLSTNQVETLSADVKKDPHYRELPPGADLRESLLVEAFGAGQDLANGVPVLLVNEPIFVASGMNSNVRYNDFYPRWAYDQYRDIVAEQARNVSLLYLDLWNIVPPQYFTNTALHINVEGERLLMEQINSTLRSMVCN